MQPEAPNIPRGDTPFTDREGKLTSTGLMYLEQLWRQIAPGFPIVPVTITGTNILTLTPTMQREGAASYGDHMVFAGTALNGSTGAVTAKVADAAGNSLATIKVYKTNGAAQAGNTDIVAGSFYLFCYVAALDSGAGGLVLK